MFDLPITSETQQFEARFSSETELLLFLTGPNGFGGCKMPSEKYWTASIDIVAWRLPSGKVEQTDACLLAQVNDDGLKSLQNSVLKNSIIQAMIRRSVDGSSIFLLVKIPTNANDQGLKDILTEQLKPVHYDDAILGRFILDRSLNCFDCEVNWLKKPVRMSFDNDRHEIMLDALQTAYALTADQEDWTRRVLSKASKDLLELKNDAWLDDEEKELTTDEFESRMELECIEVYPNGEFCFWFDDGELFWGHSITVRGTLSEGPTDADMEG